MRLRRRSINRLVRLTGMSVLLIGMGSCHQQTKQAVTVRVLRDVWIPPNEIPAAESLSAEFARQTGIELENIRGVPAETLDQLALIRRLLQQGSEGPDVMEIDESWLGTLKDDLLDLRPYFSADAFSISPALQSSYVIEDKLVAIPFQNHVGVLAFRADLLRKYGFHHPPQTWTELERMALRIQQGERTRGNKEFWGYLWPGAVAESLTCNALEWQFDEGGGNIIEKDGRVTVNNPATIRAWQRARRWIGWISPPSAPEYREKDAFDEFMSGRSAFFRFWAGEPGQLATQQNPNFRVIVWGNDKPIGEFGITAMPGGTVARAGVLGGLGLGISKYSKHPQEDAATIRFLLRKQLESFQNGQMHPLAPNPVDYFATQDQRSSKARSEPEALRPIVIARPTYLPPHVYEQVSMAYASAVHSVLKGDKSASAAASELEDQVSTLTGMSR